MIDVVLPCLNEAEALPGVLARLPAGFRAVVVDNASTDDTARVAGVLAATSELVCVLDADGSLPPEELPTLVAAVEDGSAELAVGRRMPVGAGVWPWHARAGNAVIAAMLRRRGLAVYDIAPIRAARRADLLALDVRDRASGYPLELLLRAGDAGWRVREFDVPYRPRAGGRSKVSGSLRGTVRAAVDMTTVLAGAR